VKAIRIHGPKDARYEDVPMPQPGPDDALIKIKAVAIEISRGRVSGAIKVLLTP